MGRVRHTRFRPLRYSLVHRHYQWLVDLDDLPRPPWPLRALARFDARDHLDTGRLGGGIRGDLERFLAHRGVPLAPDDRTLMLAHARVFGHVFDPLTIFWILTPAGQVRQVVFEVHNTYRQRHAYVLNAPPDGTVQDREFVQDKEFHVSPFNDTAGSYRIRIRSTPQTLAVNVELHRNGERIMAASTAGTPVPATIPALLRTALAHPFMTQQVSALIRFHGIRLWLRHLPLRRPSPTPRQPTSHSEEAIR